MYAPGVNISIPGRTLCPLRRPSDSDLRVLSMSTHERAYMAGVTKAIHIDSGEYVNIKDSWLQWTSGTLSSFPMNFYYRYIIITFL